MSIVRVGTTKQYADNWDKIFGSAGGRTTTKRKQPAKRAKPATASAKKKPAQKKASPKAARKPARKK